MTASLTPTYVASILHDGFLQRSSGGLLSRSTPIVFNIVPEEPPGSPGRGETGYKIWEILGISKSVHLGIWGMVRTVYMRSPDIDTNLSFTNQRPKGIAEQVLLEQVLPLLPELAVYEKYGYWPLFKYGLGKKSGEKESKGKGKGKTRSRAPVKSSKMEVDDDDDDTNADADANIDTDANTDANANVDVNADTNADVMALEDDYSAAAAGAAKTGVTNELADDDDALVHNMSSIHLTGSGQGKESEDDDDLPMGNMLPADLFNKKIPPSSPPARYGYPKIFQQPLSPVAQIVTQPASQPTIEQAINPTVEPTVEPTIEPTVEPTVESTVKPGVEPIVDPAVASRSERAGQPTGPVAIHNTATATASSMSTSSATATFATPSLPGPSPWGNPGALSPVDLLASLQQLPAEYLDTLPPQVAQFMRSIRPNSATVRQPDHPSPATAQPTPPAPAATHPDPPAPAEPDRPAIAPKPKPKPKPRARPVPPVETQPVDSQVDEDFGDSPLTPPSSILGGDEPVSYQESSSRGRGGGKPGRGRGRGGAKKSAGHADGITNAGGSQVSAKAPRLTRASNGTTAGPATRGAPAKQRGKK
ncbi:hypothetical protein RhiJN_06116 [Ceratobasidium sp. AG-Ba]|nr:hypothetical protein RhiJN_06116 [Ceratobasidium sp. AG-Ba]